MTETERLIGSPLDELNQMSDLSAVPQSLSPLLTSIRRHLHKNPEIGFAEHETSRFIREVLEMHGLDVQGHILSPRASMREGHPVGHFAQTVRDRVAKLLFIYPDDAVGPVARIVYGWCVHFPARILRYRDLPVDDTAVLSRFQEKMTFGHTLLLLVFQWMSPTRLWYKGPARNNLDF